MKTITDILKSVSQRARRTENTAAASQGAGSSESPRTVENRKMMIIAGLGNPGKKYEKTRHNCGFEALDVLADRSRIRVTQGKFRALCGSGVIDTVPVLLMKPQTFMNLSGEAVRAACEYYQADPATQLIVMYDDISLDPGRIRVRAKGSAGGHNGMKSIIGQLGTDQFLRIRIGTGHQSEAYAQIDWVLGHFSSSERVTMIEAFERAAQAAQALLTQPPERVMSEFNSAGT